MRTPILIASCLLWTVLPGCGGNDVELVPVSGTVTLDGKPLEGATVTFQPISDEREAPTSFGKTDEQGHFTLTTAGDETGAIVGKHLVKITKSEEGDELDDSVQKLEDPVPAEYRESGKEFTVPDGGTDAADFAMTSTGKKK